MSQRSSGSAVRPLASRSSQTAANPTSRLMTQARKSELARSDSTPSAQTMDTRTMAATVVVLLI